jgi:hypothetical protein
VDGLARFVSWMGEPRSGVDAVLPAPAEGLWMQRGSEGRGAGARRMDWDDEGGGGCGGGSGVAAVLRTMVLAMVRAKARRRRLNVGRRAVVDDGR